MSNEKWIRGVEVLMEWVMKIITYFTLTMLKIIFGKLKISILVYICLKSLFIIFVNFRSKLNFFISNYTANGLLMNCKLSSITSMVVSKEQKSRIILHVVQILHDRDVIA